jgi:hypothetical protein
MFSLLFGIPWLHEMGGEYVSPPPEVMGELWDFSRMRRQKIEPTRQIGEIDPADAHWHQASSFRGTESLGSAGGVSTETGEPHPCAEMRGV